VLRVYEDMSYEDIAATLGSRSDGDVAALPRERSSWKRSENPRVTDMKCEKFREYISLHVDGRLDTAANGYSKSTRGCRSAEALAARVGGTNRKKGGRERTPDGILGHLLGRVMQRIESEEARRDEACGRVAPSRFLSGSADALCRRAASIAVAVLVGVFFVSRHGDRVVPMVVQAPSK